MLRKNFSSFVYAPLAEMTDGHDIAFWQSQSDEAKFAEAWRLVVEACELQGIGQDELRLQRSAATLQRQVR
jgi:hypothetical protein